MTESPEEGRRHDSGEKEKVELCNIKIKRTQVKITTMSRGRIILGVLAGLAAGTAIGILFAPDKGTATRKKIVDKGEEYVDDLKEKINSLLVDGNKKHERVRESA